jgi:drug/metabolite transporter (DMT)-like permease
MNVPRQVIFFLCVGLLAASQSGNIIRIGDADPMALAAWRLLLASCMLLPFAWADLGALRKLNKSEVLLLILAGIALAAHFFTWIMAVQQTTVANAAVFFSVNPVITAVAAFFLFKEKVDSRLVGSILLGIAGVVVIGGGDFYFDPDHLAGDGSALLSSALFTIYFLLGKRLRPILPTGLYVTLVYGVAGVACFAGVVLMGLPLIDYSAHNWTCFLLLALVPTMIGHTSFNHAVRYISAGRISTATLSEPLLAGLVAFYAWGERITLQTAIGYILISLSVVVLVLDWNSRKKRSLK